MVSTVSDFIAYALFIPIIGLFGTLLPCHHCQSFLQMATHISLQRRIQKAFECCSYFSPDIGPTVTGWLYALTKPTGICIAAASSKYDTMRLKVKARRTNE